MTGALLALVLALAPPATDPCAGAASDGWLEARLRADPHFLKLVADPAKYRLQILVAEVVQAPDGARRLVRHGYRVGAEYIYPASAIKTFASVAAMRAVAALPPTPSGARADLDTPLAVCTFGADRCARTRDRSNRDGGAITLGHEIRKTQIVSDNDAFNLLYNFVGHRELNEYLHTHGFPDVRVEHRLSTGERPAGHRRTPRLELRVGDEILAIPERVSDLVTRPADAPAIPVGVAHRGPDGGDIPAPKDFLDNNAAPLCALQRLTVALVAPELGAVDLGLAPADRERLLAAMQVDPHASRNPRYTSPSQNVDRFKPLLPGIARVRPRARIRYVNKAGKAYGFHLENAYISDLETGRAFLVAAAIHADRDGVVDDDRYDYADVTVPFFADLGELLARELLASSLAGDAATPRPPDPGDRAK